MPAAIIHLAPCQIYQGRRTRKIFGAFPQAPSFRPNTLGIQKLATQRITKNHPANCNLISSNFLLVLLR